MTQGGGCAVILIAGCEGAKQCRYASEACRMCSGIERSEKRKLSAGVIGITRQGSGRVG
ncbi:hypothetical protein [Brotaphodocola sp.]|uniref:hypothetical protein n=1 Tax=Brotaphodocola sp. TaxID=3073577 RepID=UPI003D7E193C